MKINTLIKNMILSAPYMILPIITIIGAVQ